MKDNRRLQMLRQIAVLFVLVLCAIHAAHAQTYDLQIMVSGPWDFVADPDPEIEGSSDDRVILVAPAVQGHIAYIFPGVHANDTSPYGALTIQPSSSQDLSLYYLDLNPNFKTSSVNPPDEELISLYNPKKTVTLARIQSILYKFDSKKPTPRYAVSLPMPDYVRTYTGYYGVGFAEAKIAVSSIAHATPRVSYTIWTVLHYSVTKNPFTTSFSFTRQRLKSQPGSPVSDGSVTVMRDSNEKDRFGISISLIDPMASGDDRKCDKLSGLSFSASMALWHLPEHALFPVQRDTKGTQDPGNYDFANCSDYASGNLDAIQTDQRKVQMTNDTIVAAAMDLRKILPQFLEANKASSAPLEQANRDLSSVETSIDSVSPFSISKAIRGAMECTHALINGTVPPSGCPNKLTQKVIDKYFGSGEDKDGGGMVVTSVGSTDCHKAQININNVIQPQP